ncbi:hypothetical protein ABT187_15720 [Streptomyces sp. NPDC001817]|uniref:hypothetical protein n=1 Tax=Streptomyces sp. NPDC001817 TaxID=3154398 RepID=UPI0033293FA8
MYRRFREQVPDGRDGRRGALDLLTPERVVAAAAEVRCGRTVSPAAPVETRSGPDSPAAAPTAADARPSIGAVNPSLTAIADALRVGDHLLERLR